MCKCANSVLAQFAQLDVWVYDLESITYTNCESHIFRFVTIIFARKIIRSNEAILTGKINQIMFT